MNPTPTAPGENEPRHTPTPWTDAQIAASTLPDSFYSEAAAKAVQYAEKFPPPVARGLIGTVIQNACEQHSALFQKTAQSAQSVHLARIRRLEEALKWNTGTPEVKEGGCETFWCAVEGSNGKVDHRYLDYANRHAMPLADHIDEAPEGVEPVPGSDEDFYWTGWHEKSCDQCETQWMFKQKVIAWMRLTKFESALQPPEAK